MTTSAVEERLAQRVRIVLFNLLLTTLLVHLVIHLPMGGNFTPLRTDLMVFDEATIQRFKPNLRAVPYTHKTLIGMESEYDGIILSTNAEGFRDYDHELVAAPGRVRVAMMGDSFIFGAGLNSADTLPVQLERELRAAGVDAEVFNFGIPGYNLEGMGIVEQSIAAKYKPDIVTYSFITDDISYVDSHSHNRWVRHIDQLFPGMGKPLRHAVGNLLVYYKMARYHADTRVLNGIPVLYRARLRLLFKQLGAVAARDGHDVILVDFVDKTRGAIEDVNETLTHPITLVESHEIEFDKTWHPTAKSNTQTARKLVPVVKEILARRSANQAQPGSADQVQ